LVTAGLTAVITATHIAASRLQMDSIHEVIF